MTLGGPGKAIQYGRVDSIHSLPPLAFRPALLSSSCLPCSSLLRGPRFPSHGLFPTLLKYIHTYRGNQPREGGGWASRPGLWIDDRQGGIVGTVRENQGPALARASTLDREAPSPRDIWLDQLDSGQFGPIYLTSRREREVPPPSVRLSDTRAGSPSINPLPASVFCVRLPLRGGDIGGTGVSRRGRPRWLATSRRNLLTPRRRGRGRGRVLPLRVVLHIQISRRLRAGRGGGLPPYQTLCSEINVAVLPTPHAPFAFLSRGRRTFVSPDGAGSSARHVSSLSTICSQPSTSASLLFLHLPLLVPALSISLDVTRRYDKGERPPVWIDGHSLTALAP